MEMTSRKRNNIIILGSVLMISVLSLSNIKISDLPSEVQPLFDEQAQLIQLQLDNEWMQKTSNGWQCAEQIVNCHQWAEAWLQLEISLLTKSPTIYGKPKEVLLQIAENTKSQFWLLYAEQGLLKSPTKNWYQVPPSLQKALLPIVRANKTN